jgi:cytoskeletal protein RodZ
VLVAVVSRLRLSQREIGILAAVCLLIALVGVLIAVAAANGDDGDTTTTTSTSTSTTSTSTSTSTSTTSTSTSTTSTTLPPEDEDPVTTQVRAAVEARLPGQGHLVTDTDVNLIHNLKVDTTLNNGQDSTPTALEICRAGQDAGFTDVEVRSERGKNLASTGVLDNTCRRR